MRYSIIASVETEIQHAATKSTAIIILTFSAILTSAEMLAITDPIEIIKSTAVINNDRGENIGETIRTAQDTKAEIKQDIKI